MLPRESSKALCASFLQQYYECFVRRAVDSMLPLYSDASYCFFADIGFHEPLVAYGKDIPRHLLDVDGRLGARKVDIQSADPVPLPDGSVHVVCVGILFQPGLRSQFVHTFVLSPTLNRHNTFYISAEYWRSIGTQQEPVREGHTLVSLEEFKRITAEREDRERVSRRLRDFQDQVERQRAEAAAAAAAAAPPAYDDRKPRPERRAPREQHADPSDSHANNTASAAPAPAPAPAPAHGHGRDEPRGRRREAPAPKGREEGARPSKSVRLLRVPKDIKLSEISAALKETVAEPRDAFWFGQDSEHAVIKFSTVEVAQRVCDGGFVTIGTHKVKVVPFSKFGDRKPRQEGGAPAPAPASGSAPAGAPAAAPAGATAESAAAGRPARRSRPRRSEHKAAAPARE